MIKRFNCVKYIFLSVVSLLYFLPKSVYAEEIAICKYDDDSKKTSYQFTLSKNGNSYSSSGSLVSYNKKSYNQSISISNLSDFTDIFNKSDKNSICPKNLVVVKMTTYEVKSTSTGVNIDENTKKIEWSAMIYSSKADANSSAAGIKNRYAIDGDDIYKKNKKVLVETNVLNNTSSKSASSNSNNNNGNNSNKGGFTDIGSNVSVNNCEEALGKSVVELIQTIFNYIKILGPILVILFGSIDFTKAILASDEENIKKTQKKFGIRLICAIGLYFLPLLATLIINLAFGTSGSQVCGLK